MRSPGHARPVEVPEPRGSTLAPIHEHQASAPAPQEPTPRPQGPTPVPQGPAPQPQGPTQRKKHLELKNLGSAETFVPKTETAPPAVPQFVQRHITWKERLKCGFPASGGLLFGYDAGYCNGVLSMDYFKQTYGVPSTHPDGFNGYMYPTWQKSLITSILSVGTFLGSLMSGWVSNKIGRRNTILVGCAIYSAGVIFQVAGASIPLLATGRLIAGFGIGFVSANIVAYQTEICPQTIRGPCISVYQFGITMGLLIANVINQGTMTIRSNASYQIPIGLQFVFAFLLSVGLYTMLPESPRWYLSKDREDDAKKALASLRGVPVDDAVVQAEINDLHENLKRESSSGKKWTDCFTGGFTWGSNLYLTFVGTAIQMMQQLTGVNFIFYYGTSYFAAMGLSSAFLLATITNIVNVVSTPISFYTIEKYGRRPLLIYGGICMSICEFIIAIVGTILTTSKVAQIVLFIFVCLHISFFASTWGPVGWAVSGEIFPLRIRGHGIALSTSSNWFWNFVIAFVTPYLVDKEYADLQAKVFYIFGGTCALSALFAYCCVYETKGLSLEQVQDMMEHKVKPTSSKSWAEAVNTAGLGGGGAVELTDMRMGRSEGDIEERRR